MISNVSFENVCSPYVDSVRLAAYSTTLATCLTSLISWRRIFKLRDGWFGGRPNRDCDFVTIEALAKESNPNTVQVVRRNLRTMVSAVHELPQRCRLFDFELHLGD